MARVQRNGQVGKLERCYLYARVSSEEQGRGYSLPTQIESCRKHAAEKGYEVVGEYTDEHTGTELDRPGITALVRDASRERPDVVILHDLDRLGREVAIQAILEQDIARAGARIEYVLGGYTNTPEGELLKMVKGAIAQYENRQRVERSRRGKTGRALAGYVLMPAGRAPFGYDYVSEPHKGHLVVNDEQAEVVRQMFRWLTVERLSSYEIAKRLWERGILTKGDLSAVVAKSKKSGRGEWSPATVRNILSSAVYRGEWHWGKKRRQKVGGIVRQRPTDPEGWVTVAVPAIVDAATWERAQECLTLNKLNATRNSHRDYLLRGLIFCPCGRRWVGRFKNNVGRAYYRCPSTETEYWRLACQVRAGYRQEQIEAAVLAYVRGFLLDRETMAAEIERQRAAQAEEVARRAERLRAIDAALADVDRKMGALLDQALDGFPKAVIDTKRKQLADQRRDLDEQRSRVEAERDEREITPDLEAALNELAETVRDGWPKMTFAERRRVLELLRLRIDVVSRDEMRVSGIINGSSVTLSSSSVR